MNIKWPFKIWSEIRSKAKSNIDPKLGLRDWDQLIDKEKKKIWLYFNKDNYFIFDKKRKARGGWKEELVNENDYNAIGIAIFELSDVYKKPDLTNNLLENQSVQFCFDDFKNIFFTQEEDIVMEMLSIYAKYYFNLRKNKELKRREKETQKEYEQQLLKWRLDPLVKFQGVFNDIFEGFELNYRLTKGGIIPYQPKKVIEEIYDPVLEFLCDKKFIEVNRDFEDAIKHFRQKTKEGYSTCVSLCVTTIEAFLQILIYGKTGKRALSDLIKEAQTKGLIEKDFFTKEIFKNLKSIMARMRKDHGQAHPKKEYATEKNAKLMLNLTMIFLQHCIESN